MLGVVAEVLMERARHNDCRGIGKPCHRLVDSLHQKPTEFATIPAVVRRE